MRTSLLLVGLLLANAAVSQVVCRGPVGEVELQIGTNVTGGLVYSILNGKEVLLESARLGITVDGRDLGANVSWGLAKSREIQEIFGWRGNKKLATNHCVAYELPVRSGSGVKWWLEARVFRDGAAFRYRVPGAGRRRIAGESTAWQLPTRAQAWFQSNTGDYEGIWQSAAAHEIPKKERVENRDQPVYLGPPVTLDYGSDTYGLITEAALTRYSGMTLRSAGAGKLEAAFQDDPNGWEHEGEIVSPWRVLVVASGLNELVNCDVLPALCEPPDPQLFPKGFDTEWLRPGKAPCTWMVYGNDGAQWDRQKWFVDISAAIGCEYLLVDAGWRSEKWGWMKGGADLWARAAELCRYAAEKNVGIILWHAYPEGRDDSPGLTTVAQREELFRECQKAGVKGVKIDFFNSESKQVIEAYEDILRRAAKYRLLVNFHGAHKPSGEARTWPNEITREGIREQEYVLWGELPRVHYAALPFTRMAVGHADFLPGYVQPRFLKNTTAIFQAASAVVFSSPFLCWPDNPEAYLASPLAPFFRKVPVTWDETRVLPGSKIGEAVLMARRKGESWYVAVLNCRADSRSIEIDFESLHAGASAKELTIYEDGERGALSIRGHVPVPGSGKLTAEVKPGGGLLLVLEARESFPGWK